MKNVPFSVSLALLVKLDVRNIRMMNEIICTRLKPILSNQKDRKRKWDITVKKGLVSIETLTYEWQWSFGVLDQLETCYSLLRRSISIRDILLIWLWRIAALVDLCRKCPNEYFLKRFSNSIENEMRWSRLEIDNARWLDNRLLRD